MEASVAAAAVLDPEIAAKTAPDSVVATPRPAGARPTQVRAASNSSPATPLRSTNCAIRMNSGMADSEYAVA